MAKYANKVAVPVAVAVDVVSVGVAGKNDYDHGTTRNTTEAVASAAGGWAGAAGGACAGAAVGSACFPGVGTAAGGVIGGIVGGVGGGFGASAATEAIGDACDYDVVEGAKPCKKCGRKYKYRKYKRKDNGLCDKCNERR